MGKPCARYCRAGEWDGALLNQTTVKTLLPRARSACTHAQRRATGEKLNMQMQFFSPQPRRRSIVHLAEGGWWTDR